MSMGMYLMQGLIVVYVIVAAVFKTYLGQLAMEFETTAQTSHG